MPLRVNPNLIGDTKYIAGTAVFWTAIAFWFAFSAVSDGISRRPLLPFLLVVLFVGGTLQVSGVIESGKKSATRSEPKIDFS